MKVKSVVIEDVDGEEHDDETAVIRERNGVILPSPLHLVDKTLQGHDHKLRRKGQSTITGE